MSLIRFAKVFFAVLVLLAGILVGSTGSVYAEPQEEIGVMADAPIIICSTGPNLWFDWSCGPWAYATLSAGGSQIKLQRFWPDSTQHMQWDGNGNHIAIAEIHVGSDPANWPPTCWQKWAGPSGAQNYRFFNHTNETIFIERNWLEGNGVMGCYYVHPVVNNAWGNPIGQNASWMAETNNAFSFRGWFADPGVMPFVLCEE